MNKIFRITLIIFLSFFILALYVGADVCAPSLLDTPQTFYGYARYGSSVLASKTVTASIGSREWSTTTDSSGLYQIDISRCTNDTDTTISFTVCTRAASPDGNHSVGGAPVEQNLTISSACPTEAVSPGGGGGGGGGGAGAGGGGGAAMPSEVNLATKPDFATTGTTLEQTQGDTAKFTIAGTQYTAELTKLKDDSVTITVAGQSTVLKIGDSAEFDVNGDGVKDISITLKGIEGGRAEILYKLLAKAPEKPVEEEKPPEVKPPEEVKPPVKIITPPSKAWIGWLVVGAIIVVGLVAYLIFIKKKKPVE